MEHSRSLALVLLKERITVTLEAAPPHSAVPPGHHHLWRPPRNHQSRVSDARLLSRLYNKYIYIFFFYHLSLAQNIVIRDNTQRVAREGRDMGEGARARAHTCRERTA